MKQLYNSVDKILLIKKNNLQKEAYLSEDIIFEDENYIWVNISFSEMYKNKISRVFEKFYILNKDKNSLVYDAIHDSYDEIIEKDRNLENNKNIYEILRNSYGDINLFVDFGCGTGFQKRYCNIDAKENIGIDISKNMLMKAKENGFDKVYTPQEFSSVNLDIDCILISYTFHLLEYPEQDLLELTKKVKPGGMVCGNFFKNNNLNLIKNFFKKINWEYKEIKVPSKYNHGKIFLFTKPYEIKPFININAIFSDKSTYLKNKTQKKILKTLIKYNVIPTFETIDEKYILNDDLDYFIKKNDENFNEEISIIEDDKYLYLNPNTYIKFNDKKDLAYENSSLLKNFFSSSASLEVINENYKIPINKHIMFYTTSKETNSRIKENINLLNNKYNIPELTSIKTYMGTKKNLSNFILNIIFQFSNQNTKVIDLMTGTGVIASTASNFWETYASDLQNYSLILSESQGRGFNTSSKDLINFLKPYIKNNINALKNNSKLYIEKEKEFINSKKHYQIIEEYKKFIVNTPYYSNKNNYPYINRIIEGRKKDPKRFPYILFSTYFSNHYLGVSQAIEIDSIRYAIEQIEEEKIKRFALSALLGSLAQFVSSYGGHVAQPKYTEKSIKKSNISKVLEERSKTLIFDFFTRLEEIEKHSFQKRFSINTIKGPWQNAISTLENKLDNNTIVYLDPPYSRDEFGRYYHLYETLINYNYPSSIGEGRTPDKKKGERYDTEFASRNDENIEATIIKIISRTLENNWICLWSYANNSIVRMIPVIQKVFDKFKDNIEIISYSTEHKHSNQGKKTENKTIEYVIVFRRK